MTATFTRLACSCLLLPSMASLAMAAEPDLRLVTAAAEHDMAAVRTLLKQGVDVNGARVDGATALLWAAHWNDIDTADLLLAAGARVNAADDHGVTPLTRAAENASEPMVARLLRAKADPNAAQTSGLTPLMIAARTGSLPVVRQLLAAGADPNARTAHINATALMWAVSERHGAIVNALVEASADVHASTNKGFTPLMYAARNGDIEIAKALIAAGVSVNETGSDGTHVLPYSLVLGYGDFAMFLLKQGADPDSTIDGVRALHAAAGLVSTWLGDWSRRHGDGGSYGGGTVSSGRGLDASQRLRLVNTLIERGADVNARITKSAMFMAYIGYPKKGAFEPFACGTGDLYGATPLWVAAYTANGSVGGFGGNADRRGEMRPVENTTDVIKALLAAGANVHLPSDDGTTPLMVAAGLGRSTFQPGLQRGNRSTGAEEAVNVLLDAGADINAVNEADFTALHGAAFRGLNEVVEILVRRGAYIDARDYRGRTPYRLAEGSKQSFQFQGYPATAEFIRKLGANTRLSIPGTEHERIRDVGAAIAAADQP
jgi:ankyrin repeat protein